MKKKGPRVRNPRRKPDRYQNIEKHKHPDGTVCDSKRELKRYEELLLMQRAGVIRDLTVHPRYAITIGGTPIKIRSAGYPNGRHLTYVADFEYHDLERSKLVIEDVKMQSGFRTEVYKIKKALMEAMGYAITEY
ncbi:MAG: hypothetical protein AMJ84_00005 [Acidithiobacillales bacterium SM23_46]|nr:MAG: hypothetical protein AMJ84_00005 [Acidithiobacillales bacterium SM23_46]KPL28998.1 MAG: hypothetical protein AMJ72_00110 [Acidithiobacillales bacterium SM1_46]